MRNKNILKALSLLAAVCIAAGCNGSTVAETMTTTTTAEITTAITMAEVTEETTTAETERADENKYCEIPEGMTFEDLSSVLCINGKQVELPCTIDEFLKLDSRFYTMDELNESSATIYCDINGEDYLIIFGTIQDGNMQSEKDVASNCVIGLSSYFTTNCCYINENVAYGDNAERVYEIFGLPYESFEGGCYYLFEEEGIVLRMEFIWENDYSLSDFSIARFEEGLF